MELFDSPSIVNTIRQCAIGSEAYMVEMFSAQFLMFVNTLSAEENICVGKKRIWQYDQLFSSLLGVNIHCSVLES